jgi:hypothetical protein
MTDREGALALAREIAVEASTYCREAASAIEEAVNPQRNAVIEWESIARRRLRAALALLGGLDGNSSLFTSGSLDVFDYLVGALVVHCSCRVPDGATINYRRSASSCFSQSPQATWFGSS